MKALTVIPPQDRRAALRFMPGPRESDASVLVETLAASLARHSAQPDDVKVLTGVKPT